jgi:BioD-like phosphotransacetylase family protein
MDKLYIASTQPAAGKTVLAAALALRAQSQGRRAAYLKPIRIATPSDAAAEPDSDAIAVRQALGLSTPPEQLVGEVVSAAQADERVRNPQAGRAALSRIEQSTDIVVLEGLSSLDDNRLAARDADLAKALDARVLLIAWYEEAEMGEGDLSGLRAAAAPFGERLAGIILNGVPDLRVHHVQTGIVPAIRAAGLPIAGVIPQRRLLGAPTIRDIVEALEGEVIAFPEGLDELVERIMIGALALDGGIYYYGQAERKVVITRFDRPDLQMPALNTGCQALICTGGQGPIPYVWDRVQELRVPVAVVQGGTIAVASKLNGGILADRGRLHPRKVQEMAAILDTLPDVATLLAPATGATARG